MCWARLRFHPPPSRRWPRQTQGGAPTTFQQFPFLFFLSPVPFTPPETRERERGIERVKTHYCVVLHATQVILDTPRNNLCNLGRRCGSTLWWLPLQRWPCRIQCWLPQLPHRPSMVSLLWLTFTLKKNILNFILLQLYIRMEGANGTRLAEKVYTEMAYLVSKRVYEEDLRRADVVDVLGK